MFFSAFSTASPAAEPPPVAGLPPPATDYRWFFCFGHDRNRESLEKIKALVDTAAGRGLNGMVMSSWGLDSISRWPEKDVTMLKELADYCRSKKIELIPTGFSAGYGGGALGFDRNFAAALPAEISLVARDGKAAPVAGPNLFANGDLEEHKGDRFTGWGFHDDPGKVSFADTDVVASGKCSIRYEMAGVNQHGHGRIMQKVAVRPGRAYRFSCRIRTQDLAPVSGLKLMVLREGGEVASLDLGTKVKATQDWATVELDFVSGKETEFRAYAGIWGGKAGKFWLDDLRCYEYADLSDIVRREGTPLELRSTEREAKFTEGKDFAEVKNVRSLPALALPAGTAIRDGEKLTLSCYKTPYVTHSWGRQVSLCMSNPRLYEHWAAEAKRLHEVLGYRKFLLAMDEIRNGGGCRSCQDRKLTMGEILGDCVTKQREILKKIDPGIEVLIWSDMLDPAHNARANYYGVIGDFSGSWKGVPRDVVIMCWYHQIRDKSLAHFSREGFRTCAAGYYDAADLDGCREWLESLRKTPGARGIMYTTWEKKYQLLGKFGDLAGGK
ncbi:MAG TPA: hypothetical protein PK280_18940 [Planctomycetota bacterium]|nr:hypothetical protein [Planctomycetota bacterium]